MLVSPQRINPSSFLSSPALSTLVFSCFDVRGKRGGGVSCTAGLTFPQNLSSTSLSRFSLLFRSSYITVISHIWPHHTFSHTRFPLRYVILTSPPYFLSRSFSCHVPSCYSRTKFKVILRSCITSSSYCLVGVSAFLFRRMLGGEGLRKWGEGQEERDGRLIAITTPHTVYNGIIKRAVCVEAN